MEQQQTTPRWSRRVTLAVKTSVRQLSASKQPKFSEEQREETSLATYDDTQNIDEAMQSLYDTNILHDVSETPGAGSYVAQATPDWLLDNSLVSPKDDAYTAELCAQLYSNPLKDLEQRIALWEARDRQEKKSYAELENWNAFPDDGSQDVVQVEESVCGFGDFVSASNEQNDASKGNNCGTKAESKLNIGLCSNNLTNDSLPNSTPCTQYGKECVEHGMVASSSEATGYAKNSAIDLDISMISEIDENYHEGFTTPSNGEERNNCCDCDVLDNTPALVLHADSMLERCRAEGNQVIPAESCETLDTPELMRSSDILLQQISSALPEIENGSDDTPVEKDNLLGKEQRASESPSLASLYAKHITFEGETAVPYGSRAFSPLSLQLAVDDLTSIEARFTRRRQQYYLKDGVEGDIQSVDLDLPDYYFQSPYIDDTVNVLESLPWHYISQITAVCRPDAALDAADALDMWDGHTTARLCDLDSAMEQVQCNILANIQPHGPALQRANALMHDWEQNLRLAFMYWERSNEAVINASGSSDEQSGILGPSILLDLWQQQEEYDELDSALSEIDSIFTKEKELDDRIDRFDVKNSSALEEYSAVTELARALEESASTGRLANFTCLDELRCRIALTQKRFWNRLLDLSKTAVIHLCRRRRKFEWLEYERLIHAVVELHLHTSVENSFEEDLASSWTENIVAALSYEANRALCLAILEPTDADDSDYLVELRNLAGEIDLHWGDSTKLRSLAHNLVSIRFSLEAQHSYLPRVLHRLCNLLSEILHAYLLLVKWHGGKLHDDRSRKNHKRQISDLDGILLMLNDAAGRLWEQCENVFLLCLDEYVHFSPKRYLFEKNGTVLDDRVWKEDLNDLNKVLLLSDMFLKLKSPFVGDPTKSTGVSTLQPCLLTDKLADIFRRHLRSTHVEAMNTLGRNLANETWVLGSFSPLIDPERTGAPELDFDTILNGSLNAAMLLLKNNCTSTTDIKKPKCAGPTRLSLHENPFDYLDAELVTITATKLLPKVASIQGPPQLLESTTSLSETISRSLLSCGSTSTMAPQTVSKELMDWFARLLLIMEQLPLIAEDVSAVFANLSDLYFTTVLRLSAGNAKSERLILGEDAPSPPIAPRNTLSHPVTSENVSPTPLFGFGKAKRVSIAKATKRSLSILPSNLHAEICSPLPLEEAERAGLQRFIARGQQSLSDVVNLDMVDKWMVDPNADTSEEQACEAAKLLSKRESALWSCLVVASLLEVVYSTGRKKLKSSFLNEAIDCELNSLKAYSKAASEIVVVLSRSGREIACARAISSSAVVRDIVRLGNGWSKNTLHEHCNDYVDDLCDRCSLTWGYLAMSAKLPMKVMKTTWKTLLSVCFRSMLEGFARIPLCSTEGRALMTLDLATFSAGVSPAGVSDRLEDFVMVDRPPSVQPSCTLSYVQTYVKVFYYPIPDAMNWITENHQDYKLNHMLALIEAISSGVQNNNPEGSVELNIDRVKKLYHISNTVAAKVQFV